MKLKSWSPAAGCQDGLKTSVAGEAGEVKELDVRCRPPGKEVRIFDWREA